MLLSTAYCPPLSWFALAAKDFTLSGDRVIPSVVYLEACENYRKQSYRTRCRIATASGVETLSVPIVHDSPKMAIRSVRIDYSTPWLTRTERALDAAYHTSPWYDCYRSELFALMESGEEMLFDYNLSLIEYFLQRTGIACELRLTESFAEEAPEDYRYSIDSLKYCKAKYQITKQAGSNLIFIIPQLPSDIPFNNDIKVAQLGGLSAGAIAGIVIGCIAGVVILIVIIYCCCCRAQPKPVYTQNNPAVAMPIVQPVIQPVIQPAVPTYYPPPSQPYYPPTAVY